MAKKEDNEQQELEQQQPVTETPAAEAPAATVSGGSPAGSEYPKTLTAKTREEIFQQVEELKASLPEGKTLIAGAIGRNDSDGTYIIQVELI